MWWLESRRRHGQPREWARRQPRGAGPDVTRRTGRRSVSGCRRSVCVRCAVLVCVSALAVGVSQGEKLWLGGHELAGFLLALRVCQGLCPCSRLLSGSLQRGEGGSWNGGRGRGGGMTSRLKGVPQQATLSLNLPCNINLQEVERLQVCNSFTPCCHPSAALLKG